MEAPSARFFALKTTVISIRAFGAEQAKEICKLINTALAEGLQYLPVAECTEEAADFASDQMELPRFEWFDDPELEEGMLLPSTNGKASPVAPQLHHGKFDRY